MWSTWIDERGSEVLEITECRRLLTLGAARHRPGHLGFSGTGAPTVVPVDYAIDGPDVMIRVGEGLFHHVVSKLVAFEVEDFDDDPPWSVLVRGLAQEKASDALTGRLPSPRVAEPGPRFVQIRSDVITGRRLGKRSK